MDEDETNERTFRSSHRRGTGEMVEIPKPVLPLSLGHLPSANKPSSEEFRWAVLKLLLGQVQVIGAAAGLVLLLTTGINAVSLVVDLATTAATLTSRSLYR